VVLSVGCLKNTQPRAGPRAHTSRHDHAKDPRAAIRDIAAAAPEAGGNIKGWSEVQGNFNQQLSEVVAGIKSWVIELGQKLLPKATEFLGWLKDAAHWMGDHATLMKTIGEVILGAAAALLIYKTAMGAAEIATTAWKFALRAAAVAQGELNISELANPIGLIVVAIAGLVAGLIYAYKHFDTFRGIVDSTWKVVQIAAGWIWEHGLKPAFDGVKVALGFVIDHWKIFAGVLVLITGPIGVTVGAIALVVTHFTQLKNIAMDVAHWFAGPFVSFFTTGFNDVKNIAATAVGNVISAWHSFTDVVSTAWNSVIKPVFTFIGEAFTLVGKIIFAVVGTVVLVQFRIFMATVHTLWDDAIHPVLTWIGDLFHWLHDAVIKPVVGFINDAITAWGATVHWLYDNVTKPVMDAIAAAWHWVYDTAVKIVTDLINDAIRGWATTVTWLHDNVIKPVFDAISGVFHFLYDTSVKVVTDLINVALAGWGEATHFLHEQVIKPVFGGISTSFHWLYDNVVLPVIDLIKAVIADLENALHFLYDNVVKPVFDAIGSIIRGSYDDVIKPAFEALKTGVHDVGSTFETVVTAIGVIWDKLKALVATPINFVIDTVLNGGLFKAWDDVAGLVGLPKAPHMDLVKFADGGVMPGYTPGQDVHQFVSPTGGRLELSGGEAIMRPEWTRAMGGPGAVAEMNHAARSGTLAAFTDGGIASFADGGVTWPAMFDIVRKQFPWALDNSDVRPGDPGYHGKGEALDVGAPGDDPGQLAQVAAWIGSNYSNSTELIHNPNGSIKFGKSVPPSFWGAETWAAHANHVHWANDRDPHLNSGNLLGTIGSDISSAAGAVTHFLRDQVGNLFDLAMKPVGAAIGSFGSPPPAIKGLPKAMFDKTESKVRDFIVGKADAKDSASSGGGGSASLGPLGGNADAYAREITRSAMEHGFGKPGAAIGVATSIVETGLKEYANSGIPESLAFPHDAVGSDHDSVGLFQQRQAGWGTLEQRMNPHASADLFFNKLGAFDWRSMDPGAAAQRVQVSAFPDRYAQEMGRANAMVAGFDDGGWMKPGDVGANFSTKPEPVFSSSQWEVLRANLNTGGGGSTYIGVKAEQVHVTDLDELQRQQIQGARMAAVRAGVR